MNILSFNEISGKMINDIFNAIFRFFYTFELILSTLFEAINVTLNMYKLT